VRIEPQTGLFQVYTGSGKIFQAKTVIVACGTERKKLNIPGEKELIGKGVSYCVTCDAPFYKDKTVVLVGGSDAACSGAVQLGQFAKKIYLIYRKGQLRAEPFWAKQWEELVKAGKGEAIYNTNVKEIIAKNQLVGGVKLDKTYNGSETLEVDGVFIEIGGVPGVELVKPLGLTLDEDGYVVVSEKAETNMPGIFAAGDITNRSKIMQQVITAMASGAVAASSAYQYLKGQHAPRIFGN
jgi:thioredoxin reductase (NADPH)